MADQNEQARKGNPDEPQEQHFVESKQGDRALATPTEEMSYGLEQADDVHNLEAPIPVHQVNDLSEHMRQQLENYPRLPEEYFDPHGVDAVEPEKPRFGQASTHRSDHGRVVVVDYDTEHDGEIYKSGVQDLPLDVADALIADGKAWEPAGKKRGR